MRWTILILVVFSACSKPAEEAKPETKPIQPIKVPDPSAPTPQAAARAPSKPSMPSTDVRVMMGKMEKEAQNRPKAGIQAEPLFDELEAKAGIKLEERRQYMGDTMHASFCAGGYTSDHITVAMCEYPDDKAAQASLDYMNKYFGFSDAQRRMRKAAVLTVIGKKNDPRVQKAVDVFEAM